MFATRNEIRQVLLSDKRGLARKTMVNYYKHFPNAPGQDNKMYQRKARFDLEKTIEFLAESIAINRPEIFINFLEWLMLTLKSLSFPTEDMLNSMLVLQQTLSAEYPGEKGEQMEKVLAMALQRMWEYDGELETNIKSDAPLSDLAKTYLEHLLVGNRMQAREMIVNYAHNVEDVRDLYLWVFQPAMREVGRLWQMNEATVAQEHYVTAATQLIMSQLYPLIFGGERRNQTMIATCVGGELHEVGMRMVSDFFEMDGWDTFFTGSNTPSSSIVTTLKQEDAVLLGVSATMTSHISSLSEIIEAVRSDSELDHVKILVGGYPFLVIDNLWKDLGADGYGRDANEAVLLASDWFGSAA